MSIWNWIQSHWGIIATLLFLISELLGEIPSVKASSIYGMIRDFLKSEKDKAETKV